MPETVVELTKMVNDMQSEIEQLRAQLDFALSNSETKAVRIRELEAEQLPNERGTNRYGLDVAYFRKTINRELNRDLANFKPDELARVLARLSRTADKAVMHEPEFQLAEAQSEEAVMFTCHGNSAPAYSCNKPGDMSGTYYTSPPAAKVPEGYALVPCGLTDAIYHAAKRLGVTLTFDAYRAILKAAQEPT